MPDELWNCSSSTTHGTHLQPVGGGPWNMGSVSRQQHTSSAPPAAADHTHTHTHTHTEKTKVRDDDDDDDDDDGASRAIVHPLPLVQHPKIRVHVFERPRIRLIHPDDRADQSTTPIGAIRTHGPPSIVIVVVVAVVVVIVVVLGR